ncbi:MAG: methyltransferase [Nitrospiraceae bacterium]|nr:methyltransferase [Nitrospiraceae bacterium]
MTSQMTSRERVVAALRHEESDRVPVDFGSNYNTGIHVMAYNRLKKHLGITSPTHVRYLLPMLAAPDLDEGREILQILGTDIITVPRYRTDRVTTGAWKPWTLKDGSQCLVPEAFNPTRNENGDYEVVVQGVPHFRMPKDSFYFDRVCYPFSGIENLAQLEALLPSLRDRGFMGIKDEELVILKQWARQACEETDYAVLGDPYLGFSFYQVGHELLGYQKYATLMLTDPEFMHCWMSFVTERLEVFVRRYLEAVGPYIQVIVMGDDYGHQRGPQISVEMFQEFYKPYISRICALIHDTCPNVKVLLHCCGSVVPLIPEFIESGIDALNPVQTTAQGMDPTMLKREFGRDIVFWGGGVSAQTTLFSGAVEDVRNEVKEKLATFKPGGGYIFSVDHDIQANVSPEKILAAFEAAREYGPY